ncbi:MAG: peroxiredoxin, partial [Planctomycetia bacterium]|nr:peroxiredoxin [Planctomycetia bacterium]
DGTTIRLGEYRGRSAVVLFFYPKDGTPICTQEACAFRDSFADFRAAGAEVIGVNSDSVASHRAFAAKHSLPFPLVADTDGSVRKAFGAPSILGFVPGRTTYVIDKEGIVRTVFTANFAADAHVREALAALQ